MEKHILNQRKACHDPGEGGDGGGSARHQYLIIWTKNQA